MDIEVIYEDDDAVVINKPEGLMVHQTGHAVHKDEETVVDWFLSHAKQSAGVGEMQQSQKGETLERSGVVHRLDKETSGVMILAKNQEAFTHLKKQFHDRLVRKEYRAFVYGLLRERWGTINRQIGRSRKDFRLRSAQHGARGLLRPAVTDWECLKAGEYEGEAFSYMKLRPHTGRTHQIRVHLQSIGRPIVGDELYAKAEMTDSNNMGFDRLALHAYELTLQLPNGETQRFTAPLPDSFEQAVSLLVGETPV